ncbi:NAD(P)-dependent oxidoreductase [Haloplanus litoreus]
MVGGDEDVVDDHNDILETLGETITHCGESGTGQITKACNQLVVSGMIEVVAEGFVFAHQAGADLDAVYDAISGGSCRGFVMDHHGTHMLDGDHEPGFYSSYMYKDLSYAVEAAKEYGAPVPTTAVTHELYKSTIESGYGQEKNTAVIKVLENMAGGIDVGGDS